MTCKSIQIKALMAANAPVAQRAPAVKQMRSSAHAERPASPGDDALLALNIDDVHEPQTNATSSHKEPCDATANDVTAAAAVAPVSHHDSSTSHNTGAIRTSTPLNNTQRSRLDLATETGVHNNSNSSDQTHANDASAINESSIHSSGDATMQPRGDDVTAGSSSGGGGGATNAAAAVASRSSDTPETFHSVTPDGSHVTDVDDDDGGGGELTASHNSGTQTDVDDADLHERLRVPIHGYEVMEERSRFTVSTCRVLACQLL